MYINKSNISKVISRIKEKLEIDYEKFTALIALKSMDPFKLLVATILSQNTSDKNSIRAYKNLEKSIGISPHKLAYIDEDKIAEAIRVGGLYKQKAKALKEISVYLIKNFGGDLTRIISLPPAEAREKLLSLPKVGFKTADVLLLFVKNYPFFPVDTHITRISKRLGLVDQKASYEDIRKRWQSLISPNDYMKVHLMLIEFGRKICKAKNPKCDECPIQQYCIYNKSLADKSQFNS